MNPDILAEKNGFIWIQFGCTSFYSGIHSYHSCSDQNPYFPTTFSQFWSSFDRIRRCPATWPNLQNHHFSPNEIDANCVKIQFFSIPMKIPHSIDQPSKSQLFTKAGPQNWSSPATCCHQPSSVSTRCTSTVRDLGRWTRWSPLEIRENDGFHQQKSEGIHDDFTGKIMCFEHI